MKVRFWRQGLASVTEVNFGEVAVLLADPDKGSRSAIREILFERGCRNFRMGSTLAEIDEALREGRADMLICGTEFPDGDACKFIAAIRHSEIGANPFIPVIATTWDPTSRIGSQDHRFGG